MSITIPPPAEEPCAEGRCDETPRGPVSPNVAGLLESLLTEDGPADDPDVIYLPRPELQLRNKRVRTHPAGFARAWVGGSTGSGPD